MAGSRARHNGVFRSVEAPRARKPATRGGPVAARSSEPSPCEGRLVSRPIGAGLLKDAMWRTLQAAEICGVRAFAVHAKDAAARRFYEHFDFEPPPTDPMHLFVLIKDLRRLIEG